ncbi:MAG: DNA-3-methyladenine glycosylase I [Magnetococcales bacterium]|nr:DNA-3-methyladenine glycosylase I [Magnetococcales bacterium]|tara:strand:+ start:188388 stop:188984 length:597 start_codon:yes stop_codon:yes gene_type:complete
MTKAVCPWCVGHDIYEQYHHQEWGVPVDDDQRFFEFLSLEAFQAGLSWLTILKKRENFRKAFAQFDPVKVAQFTDADKQRLLADAGIVRNRLKIDATINNAQRFLEVQKEFGRFSTYLWQFMDHKPLNNAPKTMADVPAVTDLALAISKDLKKRGFKFLGPTVMYAHMQASGMVNDHLTTCPRYTEIIEQTKGQKYGL